MESIYAFYQIAETFINYVNDNELSEGNSKDLIALLMKLYLAALELPEMDIDTIEDDISEEEVITARFRDRMPLTYQGFYYPFRDNEPVCGSLLEDLNEILGDLQEGIAAYKNRHYGNAVHLWSLFFNSHWGQHAIDAIKALHELRREYDSPEIRRWTEEKNEHSANLYRAKLKCIHTGMPALKLGRVYNGYIGCEKVSDIECVSVIDVDGDGEEYGFPAEWFEVVEIIEEEGCSD